MMGRLTCLPHLHSTPPLRDITQLQNQKLKAVESSVLGLMDERAQRLQHKLHDELEKVLQQLYNIQQVRCFVCVCVCVYKFIGRLIFCVCPCHCQASDKTRRVVEERVKQSTAEHGAVTRELQKVMGKTGEMYIVNVIGDAQFSCKPFLYTTQQERRDKEDLQAQVKRLADRVVQGEVKQASRTVVSADG